MIEIALGAPDHSRLTSELLGGETERCAILLTSQTVRANGLTRLLVHDFDVAQGADYQVREEYRAVLTPDYVARVSKRARRGGFSLVFVHTHPGSLAPHFSPIDDEGEVHLARFCAHRLPNGPHAALVLSQGGMRARRLGATDEIRVVLLGDHRVVAFEPAAIGDEVPHQFDRQVRAFGRSGQQQLAKLRIGIVGLGGTGSIISQQLTHLGVRDFLLVDPDTIDETNLNRVVGATASDVGASKVEVAARYIKQFVSDVRLELVDSDITRSHVAKALTEVDILFGCTDSHGSRAVLQQIAYQYLIPCIDMGSTITAHDNRITGIIGRAQLLSPGYGCFTCGGLLNSEEVRRDMMSAGERRLDPYIQGAHEPAPAVISINGTVASLAITMFLSLVTGIPVSGRHLLYNAINASLRSVRTPPQKNCYICSRSGVFARADALPLYARRD